MKSKMKMNAIEMSVSRVRIPTDLLKSLSSIAKAEDRSRASLIRKVLKEYVKNSTKPTRSRNKATRPLL